MYPTHAHIDIHNLCAMCVATKFLWNQGMDTSTCVAPASYNTTLAANKIFILNMQFVSILLVLVLLVIDITISGQRERFGDYNASDRHWNSQL